MELPVSITANARMEQVLNRASQVRMEEGSSGAAVVVVDHGRIVAEWYSGRHHHGPEAAKVTKDTQFNVYSVRKSYIGLALALAVADLAVGSVDDLASQYVDSVDKALLGETTLRHLLTHTHGLDGARGAVRRVFAPGRSWRYNNTGVDLLCEAIVRATGRTVAELLRERVFAPLSFVQTDWRSRQTDAMAWDVCREGSNPTVTLGAPDGAGRNLFVSARELAYWGFLHVRRGVVDGRQIVPADAIAMAVSDQTPAALDGRWPRHGFYWWVQGTAGSRIGELCGRLPAGSHQIVGMSGCLCLVVPEWDLVAVRMYNGMCANRETFVKQVREFGELVCAASGPPTGGDHA
ncbi:MAG: serine hydrolase domain-containing protein [Bacilli bacterium]